MKKSNDEATWLTVHVKSKPKRKILYKEISNLYKRGNDNVINLMHNMSWTKWLSCRGRTIMDLTLDKAL